jgi:fucose permease
MPGDQSCGHPGVNPIMLYSAMAQLVFGLASFLSPQLYTYLVHNVHSGNTGYFISIMDKLVPENLKWVSLYWIFTLVTLAMIALIWTLKFPKVKLKEDEKIEVEPTFRELLANKYVILFYRAVYLCRNGTGICLDIKFLQTYHNVDHHTGADTISWFWGLMTVVVSSTFPAEYSTAGVL